MRKKPSTLVVARPVVFGRSKGPGGWKGNVERRSLGIVRGDPDVSAVRLHELAREMKRPKPRPERLRSCRPLRNGSKT